LTGNVAFGQHSQNVPSSSKDNSDASVVVLVNPAAGGGRAGEALPRLRQFATSAGWNAQFQLTASAEELATRAYQAATDGARQLFVLGGDGTFQVLLNAIELPNEVAFGILPAGGGNDLAASLGLPADPVESASLLMNGAIDFLDVAEVRTAEGNKRVYAGGGGVGLDAEAALYAGKVFRNLRGRSRYLLAAIRALIGFHSLRVHVRFEPSEGKNLEANVLLLGVLNTPSYGAGLRLAPAARTNDGCLDLVALEDLTFLEIVTVLTSLVATGELKTRRVRRFPIRWARIETDRPCLFHGDGEILGCTPVEITVRPRAVRVVCPAAVAAC
jgi:diacylglycerol kinase (ATP)